MWPLSAQSQDDCGHAAGHGFFYYHGNDIGEAMKSCWADSFVRSAPGWLDAKGLLKWRWLCASGIYHSAGNTLTTEDMMLFKDSGFTAEEFMCKHAHEWTWNDRFFERCAAGLGVQEVETRVGMVRSGICQPANKPAAAWAVKLHRNPNMQQLTCNPAKYFGTANDLCPGAFRAQFPCDKDKLDYRFCADDYHHGCKDTETRRTTFMCPHRPPPQGENEVFNDDPAVGVWGGSCTCPDGMVYLVADRDDGCGSLACYGGHSGSCNKWIGGWAFRSVHCARGPESAHRAI
jgi:hypothetical protein